MNMRQHHLKTLTKKQYCVLLIQKQHNKCAICHKKFTKTPHIDHDHATGKIRGLLCTQCNLGLGFFKDDIYNLENAINYLNNTDIKAKPLPIISYNEFEEIVKPKLKRKKLELPITSICSHARKLKTRTMKMVMTASVQN